MPTHPRPQLTRAQWTDLCATWEFAYDERNVGLDEHWYRSGAVFDREITVPFPPESPASGIDDPNPPSVVWYRRELPTLARAPGDRLLLHCNAIDYTASVWVNGHLAAAHQGGHTPFSADVTAMVTDDGHDTIVIRAEDRPRDLTQPRGKQHWKQKPARIWYGRTTGVWQPVWLEVVPATYVSSLRWTPQLDRDSVTIDVAVDGDGGGGEIAVDVRLVQDGEQLAADRYALDGLRLRRTVHFAAAEVGHRRRADAWTPERPNLITAEVTLRRSDQVIDSVGSYFGMRTVATANGRFVLNSRPYYPRLVLYQGYWPDSNLAAPTDEALRAEVELIKTLGFNGVRVHQKVEDPRFLSWCDRLGLLVWGEMPSAHAFTPAAVQRLTSEWMEVLQRDYSHPSVVMWVPFNESWGVPMLREDPQQQHYVEGLYHLTRALDPTRPVIGNDGWEYIGGNVYGVHDYALDGDVLRERYGSAEAVTRTLEHVQPGHRALTIAARQRQGEPVMLTECGGISFAPQPGTTWFGYGTVPDADAFVTKYEEVVGAILDCEDVAGFCYTQLADVGQETNGLVRADRTPKAPVEQIAAVNRRFSRAIPADLMTFNTETAADVSGRQDAPR